MTSKEVKVYLSKQIAMCEEKIELYENVKTSKDFIELHKNLLDFYKTIEKDLVVLENIKSKTLLFYSDRKKIAEEYEKWCKDNNVMISDTTNMITWVLCFKLKEWLENDR